MDTTTTTRHVPVPEQGGPYDVCARCDQAITTHWSGSGALVTMLTGSTECYGRRNAAGMTAEQAANHHAATVALGGIN